MTDKEQIRNFVDKEIKKVEHLEKLYGRTTKSCLVISIYTNLINYIDSLPREPISENLRDESETMMYQGEKYIRVYRDELDKFACKYPKQVPPSYKKYAKYSDVDLTIAVKAGAEWQKEQFENNRLKHCNSITNEQAELEQGFIDQHLDKHQRMPTFLDAIEYGMNLQKEEMIKNAVDSTFIQNYGYGLPILEGDLKYKCDLKSGDKVKLVIIKENNK